MIKVISVVTGIVLFNPLYAEIYKWTDSQGIVHFSDEPHPGAETITLPPSQTSTSTQQPVTPPNNNAATTSNKAVEREYQITITQPKNDVTIRNNQGYIPVLIDIQPEIQAGDSLQLIFDGKPVGKPQASNVFTLNNVNRGSHTIAVEVLDSEHNVLITSDSITIHMQRPRVGMVPNTQPKNNTP